MPKASRRLSESMPCHIIRASRFLPLHLRHTITYVDALEAMLPFVLCLPLYQEGEHTGAREDAVQKNVDERTMGKALQEKRLQQTSMLGRDLSNLGISK